MKTEHLKKGISKRYRRYLGADTFVFITICKCGETVSGWGETEADEQWNKHRCLKVTRKKKVARHH